MAPSNTRGLSERLKRALEQNASDSSGTQWRSPMFSFVRLAKSDPELEHLNTHAAAHRVESCLKRMCREPGDPWVVHFPRAEAHEWLQRARKRVSENSREDWEWLHAALNHSDKKWFAAEIFRFQPVPKRLFRPIIRAAVLERDPSVNRVFVEPCVGTFGAYRVCDELLMYVTVGTDHEKGGAASAFYEILPDAEDTALRPGVSATSTRSLLIPNSILQVHTSRLRAVDVDYAVQDRWSFIHWSVARGIQGAHC